jgi:hypothetical protein
MPYVLGDREIERGNIGDSIDTVEKVERDIEGDKELELESCEVFSVEIEVINVLRTL